MKSPTALGTALQLITTVLPAARDWPPYALTGPVLSRFGARTTVAVILLRLPNLSRRG